MIRQNQSQNSGAFIFEEPGQLFMLMYVNCCELEATGHQKPLTLAVGGKYLHRNERDITDEWQEGDGEGRYHVASSAVAEGRDRRTLLKVRVAIL